jgi:hypothetical protein
MDGNYPLGAEFDPRAPYNQPEPIEKNYEVEVTATLYCSTTVTSNDAYYDEYGELCEEAISLDTDFLNQKHSPKDLIKYLYNILREHPEIKFSDRKSVLDSCGMWLGGNEEIETDRC